MKIRKKANTTNIRDETGLDFISEAIKKIIREYYKKLYAHNFDNFKEMDQFQPTRQPNFNQDEINNLKNHPHHGACGHVDVIIKGQHKGSFYLVINCKHTHTLQCL